jgi:hypothetical protein
MNKIRITGNRVVDAVLLTLMGAAMLHMVELVGMGIYYKDPSYVNIFNIFDLPRWYSRIDRGLLSNVISVVIILAWVAAMYVCLGKNKSSDKV